jgi:hypothetical protein
MAGPDGVIAGATAHWAGRNAYSMRVGWLREEMGATIAEKILGSHSGGRPVAWSRSLRRIRIGK